MSGSKPKNILGEKFYMLTAIEFIRTEILPGENRLCAVWLWQCECGNKIEKSARAVKRGYVKSCGCHVNRGSIVLARAIWKKTYADGDITLERFMELSQLPCFYCGVVRYNKPTLRGNHFEYNGLDRLDSNGYHDENNVVPCCWPCNKIKTNIHMKDFLEWIRKVYHTTKEVKL
jgi:hypothetical protein